MALAFSWFIFKVSDIGFVVSPEDLVVYFLISEVYLVVSIALFVSEVNLGVSDDLFGVPSAYFIACWRL